MSLTGALNNAISGLTANTRAAGIVSSNIANALTEGYGRRELAVSSDTVSSHGGVRVDGVLRHVDPVVQAERRLAAAAAGQAGDMRQFHSEMERVFGSPTDESSLTGFLNAFESTLIAAATDPSSSQRLANVAQAGEALTDKMNTISDSVQSQRMEAEVTIESMVDDINASIGQIKDLNTRISAAIHTGRDRSALLDQRQQAVDALSELVPLRILPRDRDTIAVMTMGGTMLLDGTAAELSFTRSNRITPETTLESGALSALSINGRVVDASNDGPLAGGRLSAQFEIRDTTAVGVQAKLDALALDLTEAFGAGGPDTTLQAGDRGLFTDAGQLATSETGLAQRIEWNDAVASTGTTLWKIRDGLGAATSGNVGDATLINAMRDRLNTLALPASDTMADIEQTVFVRFAEVVTTVTDARVDAERLQTNTEAQLSALKEIEYANGVDSDAELERLMQIEQNFAANAQVISVVDDLMRQILNM